MEFRENEGERSFGILSGNFFFLSFGWKQKKYSFFSSFKTIFYLFLKKKKKIPKKKAKNLLVLHNQKCPLKTLLLRPKK